MNISFYLKSPEKAESLLMLYATFNRQRLRISTGEIVPVKAWDNENQRIRKSSANSLQINTWLEALANEMKRNYLEAKSLGLELTPSYLKEKIQEFRAPSAAKPVKPDNFLADLQYFIDNYITKDGIKPKDSTMKGYRTLIMRLGEFEAEEKYRLSLSTMNEDFYKKFVSYLYRKGLTDNAVGKYIKNLNVYLRDCYKKGILETEVHRKFKVIQREATTIALTDKELKAIIDLDLSENPRLSKIRDIFLLQCYTGLRYEDLASLQPEHFDLEDKVIRRHSQKTTGKIWAPILPPALTIIEKYSDLIFPFISIQKMNTYIKELGKLAGMTKKTIITRFKGNEQIDEVMPRYDALGTHTARRTFITESLRRGVASEIIMRVTGHKNRKDFDKYVRFVEDTVKNEMVKAWG